MRFRVDVDGFQAICLTYLFFYGILLRDCGMCLWHFTVWDISLNTGNMTHQNGDNIGDNNRVYPYTYIYTLLYYITIILYPYTYIQYIILYYIILYYIYGKFDQFQIPIPIHLLVKWKIGRSMKSHPVLLSRVWYVVSNSMVSTC